MVIYPFLFLLYYAIPARWREVRNGYLLIVSYLLYMNFNAVFALVLLGVTLLTYLTGRHLDEWKKNLRGGKIRLSVVVLLTLLPLLFFKYYNFINSSCQELLALVGLRFAVPGLNWAVPVGISFYTFQALGYVWDVWHQRVKPERNFLHYALFVGFFPQVASGPISKAEELLPQIKGNRAVDTGQIVRGLQLLLWGIFLKVVIADRLGLYVDKVYENFDYCSGKTLLIASVFYTIQIYADFAGYSLMAIGVGKTLGFDLINNFKRPYFATSITDFWKRWHISLTRWLTQHVYIQLGGNRCSKLKCYRNIILTFLVSGLWHGANWTFVAWGLLHGLFQVIEKSLGLQKCEHNRWCIEKPLRMLLTFLLVTVAWIFFRMPTIGDAATVVCRIATNSEGVSVPLENMIVISFSLLLLIAKEIYEEYDTGKLNVWSRKFVVLRWIGYVGLVALVLLYGVLDSTQFIYVSF